MRMRTIPKAFEAVKQADPNTDLTLRALRRMVNNGEIPVVRISNKVLINLDLLLDKLSCYNDDATCAWLSMKRGNKHDNTKKSIKKRRYFLFDKG